MSLTTQLGRLSKQCLHGRDVPPGLAALWRAQTEGDPFLEGFGVKLLDNVDRLQRGFSLERARGNPDVEANCRAHWNVFERLGFFAELDDGELLAFDLQTDRQDDPPVVQLDTEGQYRWFGINLAEAIFRIADVSDQAESVRRWLARLALHLPELGELGSTTQFLPSIQELQTALYRAERGLSLKPNSLSGHPADPSAPLSWLGRPGTEVCEAITALLGLPPGSTPPQFWVWCDGNGLVTTFRLPRVPEVKNMVLRGIRVGMTRDEVIVCAGPPDETGMNGGWWAHTAAGKRLHLAFDNNDKVSRLTASLVGD